MARGEVDFGSARSLSEKSDGWQEADYQSAAGKQPAPRSSDDFRYSLWAGGHGYTRRDNGILRATTGLR